MRALICLVFIFSVSFGQASSYMPPVFPDADREPKVHSTRAVVDQLFNEHMEKQHLPGLVYGVVLDGKLVYSGAFGYSNLEKKHRADESSLFRIASMSKSFTALAILQLRDAGKLNLDDWASKYIPEMKNLKYLAIDAPAITIRHLLTHGAGFPEDNPWGDRQLADTDADLRKLMADGPSFSNVPGLQYEYSNVGFALLGQIVQVVSGMDFQEYTRERIFKPLGMNSTVWEYEESPERKLALGYSWAHEAFELVPLVHHGSYGAMGGLITSIEDFARYVSLHLAGWPPRNDADTGPLKRSSLREMHHPWRFSRMNTGFRYPSGRECATVNAYGYGLGWSSDCQGRVTVGHSGGLPGFGSNWTMMPQYGLAVMSFDNRTYGGTSGINLGVLDTILAMTNLQPLKLPPSDILKKRQQQLASLLPDWKDAEKSGLFAENFFLDNPIKNLHQWTALPFEKAGKIIGMKEIVPENQLRGTFILEGEKTNIAVFFTLTPEPIPLIQQVRMRSVGKEQ
ncbi:MAG: beta-lactamase family protein [Ignavibacteriales bacterium]|nr:beta-lactamase family protein [Ignavibacteriales bacterium]